FMYIAAGLYVLIVSMDQIPAMLKLIVTAAFTPLEAEGAFIGGTAGYAFLWGMKRALYSNEAGQGSSPIAHSAAKTDEPAREGILAGMEPFIDTIVVCTITALVILLSGIWMRPAEAVYDTPPAVVATADGAWTLERVAAPPREGAVWRDGDGVYVIVEAQGNAQTGNTKHRLDGTVVRDGLGFVIQWGSHRADQPFTLDNPGIYVTYAGATL